VFGCENTTQMLLGAAAHGAVAAMASPPVRPYVTEAMPPLPLIFIRSARMSSRGVRLSGPIALASWHRIRLLAFW
jgi:hypothetical protein